MGWPLIRNWKPMGIFENSTWRLVQRSGTLYGLCNVMTGRYIRWSQCLYVTLF